MAALAAIQHNPLIKATYQRLVAQGRPNKVAIIACVRQPLSILTPQSETERHGPNRLTRRQSLKSSFLIATSQKLPAPRALSGGRGT
jgi:hypothetical protein